MDIRDLEYLAVAAETENFGRSAEALGVNVSTVSRRISRIEDELGLTLFERRHSGVCLTTGGRAVMRHVKRALDEVEGVKRFGMRLSSGLVGEVRLGIQVQPLGEPLLSLLGDWRARHPGVTLTVSEIADGDLASPVEARRLDVVVAPSHVLWPQAASTPLYRENLMAVLPEGHPASDKPSVTWDDVRREEVLIQDGEGSQAAREFYASVLGTAVRVRLHTASKKSIYALVRAGFGIAFATYSQAEAVCPGVILKAIDERDASVQMVLAWRADLEDPVVGRFVACLRDDARSRRLC